MTSKNPDNGIEANIAFERGYISCSDSSKTGIRTQSTECDPGYISDTDSLFCYMVLPDLMTYLSCVSFTNILGAPFALILLRQKSTDLNVSTEKLRAKLLCEKATKCW
jgi:hypothetical protein